MNHAVKIAAKMGITPHSIEMCRDHQGAPVVCIELGEWGANGSRYEVAVSVLISIDLFDTLLARELRLFQQRAAESAIF